MAHFTRMSENAMGWNHFSRISHNRQQAPNSPPVGDPPDLSCGSNVVSQSTSNSVWIGQGSLKVMDRRLSDSKIGNAKI